MRRASKKFWQLVSAIVVAALAIQAASTNTNKSNRPNELTLAGLRPGHDKMESPRKKFRELDREESITDSLVWGDICTHHEMRIEIDTNKVVSSVTVDTNFKPEIAAKCTASVIEPKRLKLLATGRGLQLGDACDRVTEIYGKAESESSFVERNEQIELFLYSFGWAGRDVPQEMEVSCNASSHKVVSIMLAASTP